MTVYINGQGHMTKMAAMAINSKKNLKIFFSRNRRPMILKLGMKQQGEELYKVYINHDLGMTLTYFIYPSSQVSVYRTIGPLVLKILFQGRVMYDLILYSITTSDGASVLMECQRDIAGQVLTDIKRFKIRKKVLISKDVIDPLTNTYMTVNMQTLSKTMKILIVFYVTVVNVL